MLAKVSLVLVYIDVGSLPTINGNRKIDSAVPAPIPAL